MASSSAWSTPGALIVEEGNQPYKFFVTALDGHIWENYWDVPTNAWQWDDHGTPALGIEVVGAPGALITEGGDQPYKFFVTASDGHLWENYWDVPTNAWQWDDHGTPARGVKVADIPGALIVEGGDQPYKVFVRGFDGHIWENYWDVPTNAWQWDDHGTPALGIEVVGAPGALITEGGDQPYKFFVTASDGHLWENYWDVPTNAWQWDDHGTPARGVKVADIPGALIVEGGDQPYKVFVRGFDGHIWENYWDVPTNAWQWDDHGTPALGIEVVGAPGALITEGGDQPYKFFVTASDGHLWENYWDVPTDAWQWDDHGTPARGIVLTGSPNAMIAEGGDQPYKLFISCGQVFENYFDIPTNLWRWGSHAWPGICPSDGLTFDEQDQQQSEWCWAATTVSITEFYNPSSSWTQCTLVNKAFKRKDCCNNAGGKNCNIAWYPDRALSITGHLSKSLGSNLSSEIVASEICYSHPISIAIFWYGGGGHNPVITGFDVSNPSLLTLDIQDPIYGFSVQDFNTFPSSYQGGASWGQSFATK